MTGLKLVLRLSGLALLLLLLAPSAVEAQMLPAAKGVSAPAAPVAGAPPAAQTPGGDIQITGLGGNSAPWSIVVLLTLLTLIPSLLVCVTPFARLADRVPFPAAGARVADDPVEPDADRLVDDHDVLLDAARGSGSVRHGGRAAAGGDHHTPGSAQPRR